MIACLLLLLFGFDILSNRMVVVVSTILPLSFSLALIYSFYATYHKVYSIFCIIGFLLIFFSRYYLKEKIATIILAVVHGIAGLLIFILPLVLTMSGKMSPQYSLISVGGTLIGISGLLLAFLKMGKPILLKHTIYKLLPGILFLMTFTFIAGMYPGNKIF